MAKIVFNLHLAEIVICILCTLREIIYQNNSNTTAKMNRCFVIEKKLDLSYTTLELQLKLGCRNLGR